MGDVTHQRHDFEPGIARSGLFWTVAIPASTVSFDTAMGEARYRLSNFRVRDFHDIGNAVAGGGPKPVPSHVSFDVRWHGHGAHRNVRDHQFGFEGEYVAGPTTVSFIVSQDGGGVTYRSDPAGQYNPSLNHGGSGPPAVGRERNGMFFK